jgi:alpha-methylacyl-CoA racemase
LGLSPDDCWVRRPALVYGRMTGWGQEGPWAQAAGHDLDYIAIAGVLAHIARRGAPPTPPLNLVADYGGGAMLLVVGVLAALWESQRSGRGQVVDAAMVDGGALLMSLFHGMAAQGMWQEEAGVNLLDSGAPFYDVYRTADDRWLAVACLEPAFYAEWLRLAGIDAARLPAQFDVARWDEIRDAFAAVIATRTRDEWARLVDGSDACVAPVLTMDEAPRHAHLAARGTFVEIDGIVQAAPAPRFSRTAAARPTGVKAPQASALTEWGVDADRVSRLSAAGVIADGVA